MINQTGLSLEICLDRLKATVSVSLLLVALACLSTPAYAALVMCPRDWNEFIGVAETEIESAGDKRTAKVLFIDSADNIRNRAGENISAQELTYIKQFKLRSDDLMCRALGPTECERITPKESCKLSVANTRIGRIVFINLPIKESEMVSEGCIATLDFFRSTFPDWISSRDQAILFVVECER